MTNLSKADLVGAVELANKKNGKQPVYHAVYASQLYGTFFGVFGEFRTKKAAKKDALEITRITFRILNYSGIVNIGFSTKQPNYVPDDDNATIYLGVRAGSEIYEKTIKFKKSHLVVEKNIRKRLVIQRVVFPAFGFVVSGANDTPTSPKPQSIPSGQLFDREFYSRTGLDWFCEPTREGMSLINDGKGVVPLPIAFPSPRCVGGNVNLIH